MKITIERIIIVVLLVLLGWDFFHMQNMKDLNRKLVLENYQLDSVSNVRGQTILLQESNVLNTKAENAQLLAITDSLFALKKKDEKKIKDIIAFYQAHTITRIDSVDVPFIDTAERVEWETEVMNRCQKVIDYYEANTITVPRTARDTTSLYTADFTTTLNGVRINMLSIPDSQYIRFVTLKGGLFKKDQKGKRHLFTKKSIQVQVLHTNPLIHVGLQTTAIYQPKMKPRLLEKILLVGVGVFLGTKL